MLIKPPFDFAHFFVLCCFSNVCTSCLFFYLVDDTHIFGHVSIVTSAFDHFISQLAYVGPIVQPHICLIWSPLGLFPRFSPLSFCYVPNGIKVLSVFFCSFSYPYHVCRLPLTRTFTMHRCSHG